MAGPPYPVPNQNAPNGVAGCDAVTGAIGAVDLASYAVQTAGTNTLATGRASAGGIFQGAFVTSGTPVYQAFDVIVSGTTTTTNALTALTTATLGQLIQAGPQGVGVRFLGNLVTVITGTSTTNTLWD
jgi:hypothetical protein